MKPMKPYIQLTSLKDFHSVHLNEEEMHHKSKSVLSNKVSDMQLLNTNRSSAVSSLGLVGAAGASNGAKNNFFTKLEKDLNNR